MKANADYREFKDLDDVINDMEETLSGLSEESQEEKLENLSLFINDWYYDYQLTDEEFKEIEKMVKDFFSDDIDELIFNIVENKNNPIYKYSEQLTDKSLYHGDDTELIVKLLAVNSVALNNNDVNLNRNIDEIRYKELTKEEETVYEEIEDNFEKIAYISYLLTLKNNGYKQITKKCDKKIKLSAEEIWELGIAIDDTILELAEN